MERYMKSRGTTVVQGIMQWPSPTIRYDTW